MSERKILLEAKILISNACQEHCRAYNELCGSKCGEAVLSVLDGELRMAVQLRELEKFYGMSEGALANEYEVRKFAEKEIG